MNPNSINPKSSLTAVIEGLVSELNKYKQTEKPNQYIIDKRNALISELSNIESEIQFYNNHSLYTSLYEEIERLYSVDPNLERISVNIDLKPFTNRVSTVNVKCYANQ